jgi:hypothetical protein
MAGRYLYGDSEPFPGGYDFLASLRAFVQASSKALELASEADEMERSLGERAQEHLAAIEALQTFFAGASDLIVERAARSVAPQIVGPYANQIADHIDALGAQARATRAKELDGASVEVTSRIRDKRTEIRKVVGEYLLADPLPIVSWALSLSLAGTSPNGQAVLEHPGELSTNVSVDLMRDGVWSRPRRIGDLAPGLAMQVGFKKAFMRSSVQPDVVTLDELVIGALEVGPDSIELHLRRRLDAPRDAFLITVDPTDDGRSIVKITRMDERGGGNSDAPFESQGEEAARILELSVALRRECANLLSHRKRLLSAQLDGHEVFERGLVQVLLSRIAERLAPIAAEVSRHSPNPSELSLKLERDGGRREEVYLRKADLVQMVASLPPEAQQLYAGLAFLPRTSAPPAREATEPVPLVVRAPAPVVESQPPPAATRPSAAPPPPKRKW